jgi:hypothetical protein
MRRPFMNSGGPRLLVKDSSVIVGICARPGPFSTLPAATIKLTHYPRPSIGCTVACFPQWLTLAPTQKPRALPGASTLSLEPREISTSRSPGHRSGSSGER